MFILVPVVGSRICHPVAELTQCDRSHVAPTLKCLPPGPLQVKLVAFSLRGGFSTRNAPGNALCVPASFLGSWLAVLCRFACPLHEPLVGCEEVLEFRNHQFPV